MLDSLKCQVVVIGAGVTGSLVGHRLAKSGMDVVIVDQGQAAAGSTAACTALIQYDLDQPLIDVRKKHGQPFADETYKACARALDTLEAHVGGLDFDCNLTRRPSLLVARRSRDAHPMKQELEARREVGIDVDWVDQDELKTKWNIDRPAAIASSRSFEIDPYALTVQTLREAGKLGARIFSPVEIIWSDLPRSESSGPSCRLQTTHGLSIEAEHVVIATGYQTPAYVRKYSGKLLSTWAACSTPVDNIDVVWPNRQLIWEWGTAYLYARTRPDGRVIFGGGDRGFKNESLRNALTESTIASLIGQLEKLVPGLKLQVEYKWSGTFGETKDGMPYIGSFADDDRVHFALGFGGNGVTFSVLAAEIITGKILRSPEIDSLARLFAFDR